MFKAFPLPDFIPEVFEVVTYTKADQAALVITKPCDPPEADMSSLLDRETRPCICDIMLGETVIKNVDVSELRRIQL